MGSTLSRKSTPKPHVGILGLDNAGKATIFDKLRSHRYVMPNRKGGWRFNDCELSVWKMCRKHGRKGLMKQYRKKNIRAIIFVVDSSDFTRLPEAVKLLRWLVHRPELASTVFLVFANKQDTAEALDANNLSSLLDMQSISQKWTVQECCANTGIGLSNGLIQLKRMLQSSQRSDCGNWEEQFDFEKEPNFDFVWGDPNETTI